MTMRAAFEETSFDPWDDEISQDPYPHYARLRDHAPVHFLERRSCWLVSRYGDVRAVLTAKGVFSSEPRDGWGVTGAVRDLGGAYTGVQTLISSDPPNHTRLRRLLAREFTPRAIGAWEPFVRRCSNELIDVMADHNAAGSADLVRDLATPLPMLVIAEILGVPASDRETFKRWTEEALGFASLMPGMRERSRQAGQALHQYFVDLIADKADKPGDDLVGLFIRAGQREEDAFSHAEIIAHCELFLIAGGETTTNLIGNTICAFDAHPSEARLVQDDPGLIPQALEEALRYDGSSLGMFRTLDADATIASTTLPAGSHVFLLFGAANHDERHWGTTAEKFMVGRNATNHLGFGAGIHLCIGAPLARLEARVAMETLLQRTRDLQISGEPVINRNVLVRGRWSIPVAFETVAG